MRGAWLKELGKHQPLAVPLVRTGLVDKLPKRSASLSERQAINTLPALPQPIDI